MKRVLSGMALRACALLVVAVVMTGTKLQAAVQPIMLSYTNNMIVAAVSAGALDSTSKLWLVWDSVDRGSDFSAWSVENRIQYAGDIPSADSTYVFDRSRVPAGSVFRVIATKMARSLGEGGYVYAGANQYIDTGIKANTIYGLYIKFMYSANDWSGSNRYSLLIANEGNKDFAVGRYAASGEPDGKFYVKHRNTTGTPNGYFDISGSGLGQVHEFAIANQTATLDGVTVVSELDAGAIGQKNLRVWLSNGYPDNTMTEPTGTIPERCCHARWYAVRFDDENGDPILNLVPAVCSGAGILFDTISGRCLANANAATGDLTWGGGELGDAIEGSDSTSAASDAVVNEITVAIVSRWVEVGVPAGALTSPSELWMVWDSEDHGRRLEDWPVANRVKYDGEVSSAAATYRFEKGLLPFRCVFRIIATELFSLLSGDGYIYVGANQYINTGVNANAIYGLSIKFQYSANDWNQGSGGNAWSSLIGDDPTYDFTIGRKANGSDGQFYMRYRGVSVKSGTTADLAFTFDTSAPHVITIANQTSTLDGATAVATLEEGSIGTQAIPVLLGCSWAEHSTVPGKLSQRYCHAKWYSVRFDDADGNALLNLKPAVWKGEGVMYDSVSGNILHNSGSGSLTYDGTPGESVGIAASASVPILLMRRGFFVYVR